MRRPVNCQPSRFAALIALLLALVAGPAAAEKRIALVVGNSAYQNITRLDNPGNDAVLIADTLGSLGFILIRGRAQLDLDKPDLDTAVQNFGRQVQGADVALFYYAGHGVQVSGSNYLVPVSANPTREADVDFQMVDINLQGLSGTVSPSCAASSVGNYDGITVISSGRVSGRSGSGTFRRSDGCTGRWTSSKQ
jgi:hypothetical protein